MTRILRAAAGKNEVGFATKALRVRAGKSECRIDAGAASGKQRAKLDSLLPGADVMRQR
jgi:hypothetical protein